MPNRARQIVPFPVSPGKTSKRPRNKVKLRWPRLLVFALLLTYFACAGVQWVRQEMRMRALKQQYEALLIEMQRLHADNKLLQQQIERLQNDPTYLEQLAREMGMVKPGDTIYLPIEVENPR
ncbi:MAG: septum formation initiator family protein [Firmicutes bacterium]|nr:septum formation initiator family protein [Bacillota bacterium]